MNTQSSLTRMTNDDKVTNTKGDSSSLYHNKQKTTVAYNCSSYMNKMTRKDNNLGMNSEMSGSGNQLMT